MQCNLVEWGSLLVNPLCLALRREKIEKRMFSLSSLLGLED